MSIALRSSDELLPVVQPMLLRMFAGLRVLLPEAELDHIGATAVPGALTKGDLDILVRVSPPAFPAAVEVLKQHSQTQSVGRMPPGGRRPQHRAPWAAAVARRRVDRAAPARAPGNGGFVL